METFSKLFQDIPGFLNQRDVVDISAPSPGVTHSDEITIDYWDYVNSPRCTIYEILICKTPAELMATSRGEQLGYVMSIVEQLKNIKVDVDQRKVDLSGFCPLQSVNLRNADVVSLGHRKFKKLSLSNCVLKLEDCAQLPNILELEMQNVQFHL